MKRLVSTQVWSSIAPLLPALLLMSCAKAVINPSSDEGVAEEVATEEVVGDTAVDTSIAETVDGSDDEVCEPYCPPMYCGPDGCGRPCPPCGDGLVCRANHCISDVETCPQGADCSGLQCGPDPICSTSCGSCRGNDECRDGQCVCLPSCASRECGSDGCDSTCGDCEQGEFCADGVCRREAPQCPEASDCSGRSCGPDPVCGVSCGTCEGRDVCRDGQCLCIADCGDRQCGDDGCGGSCGGCGPGFICDSDGRCTCPTTVCDGTCCAADERCANGRCCRPYWRTEVANRSYGEMAFGPDGTLYVTGTISEGESQQMVVTRFDGCGEQLNEVALLPPGWLSGGANGLDLVGDDLFIAGWGVPVDDPQNGTWARLTLPSLQTRWVRGLYGGTERDEVWDIVVAGSDRIWMSGATRLETAEQRWWAISGATHGDACGFPVHVGGIGRRLVMAPDGTRVYLTGSADGVMTLHGFDPENTNTEAPCDVDPVFSVGVPLDVGVRSEGFDIAFIGNDAYVAGFIIIEGIEMMSLLARIDTSTGQVLDTVTWNPTPLADGFVSITAVEGGLVVTAVRGWDGGSSLDTIEPSVLKYTPDLRLSWERTQAGTGLLNDVAVDGDGSLLLLLTRDESAVVWRCSGEGVCP